MLDSIAGLIFGAVDSVLLKTGNLLHDNWPSIPVTSITPECQLKNPKPRFVGKLIRMSELHNFYN